MINKKFKYQELLARFPNCPPQSYVEVEQDAFRWVHKIKHENDFRPVNLINDPPPRKLDDSDYLCKGYALSLFDSLDNAIKTYKKRHRKTIEHFRKDFIDIYGECIATLKLSYSDGVAGELSSKSGHFTFHEYESSSLSNKIHNPSFNIFDTDGTFNH